MGDREQRWDMCDSCQWYTAVLQRVKTDNGCHWIKPVCHLSCPVKGREKTTRTLAATQVSSCHWCLRAYTSPCSGRVENARRDQALRASVTQAPWLAFHTPIAGLGLPGEHEAGWRVVGWEQQPPLVPKCMSEVNIGGAFPRTDRCSKGIRGCSVEQCGTKEPHGKLVRLRRASGALCPWVGG
jgi:hypothetical protein